MTPAKSLCTRCTAQLRAGKLGEMCSTCAATVHASAPEGWQHTVERMKQHSDIDNPFALSHWMDKEGYTPHDAAATGAMSAAADDVMRVAWQRFAERRQKSDAGMHHFMAHALQPDVTQQHLAPIKTEQSPEGEGIHAGTIDTTPEGTHPEPDGDETFVPGVGLVEPLHASARELSIALTLALAAACETTTAAYGGRGHHMRRAVASEPLRYTFHASAETSLPYLAAAMGHPNRIPFKAILHPVDAASDKAPNGAQGHRVVIPRDVAARNLHTLIGMGVNVQATGGMKGHTARNKVGVITHASLGTDPDPSSTIANFTPDANSVMIAGWLYGKDFPNEVKSIMQAARAGVLGTSYEVSDVSLADPNAETWTATNITYTGMAALRKDAAAYRATSFSAACE